MGCVPKADCNKFGIDADRKTLYWNPGDKKIPIFATRGGLRFLASKYGTGGTYALRSSLELTSYKSGISRLSKEAVETLQRGLEFLHVSFFQTSLECFFENIEMKDFAGAANDVIQTEVETALKTTGDQPVDTAWVTQAKRELAGLEKAMTGVRDELENNLAKLSHVDDRKSEVEKRLALELQI